MPDPIDPLSPRVQAARVMLERLYDKKYPGLVDRVNDFERTGSSDPKIKAMLIRPQEDEAYQTYLDAYNTIFGRAAQGESGRALAARMLMESDKDVADTQEAARRLSNGETDETVAARLKTAAMERMGIKDPVRRDPSPLQRAARQRLETNALPAEIGPPITRYADRQPKSDPVRGVVGLPKAPNPTGR